MNGSLLSFLPVGKWSLSDLDCTQLLDVALQTHRHVGVWDVESLPLPASAAGTEAVWGGGRRGGRA